MFTFPSLKSDSLVILITIPLFLFIDQTLFWYKPTSYESHLTVLYQDLPFYIGSYTSWDLLCTLNTLLFGNL